MTDSILVVLPTLGERLDTLEEALASVSAQRGEVDITLAVVLPPNATKARTLAKVHGALIVDDPRRGLAGAMNAGLRARTIEKYYVGLGDDDLLRPGGIAHLISIMDSTSGAVVAYGGCDYIDDEGRVIGSNQAGRFAAAVIAWGPNLVPHPGSLISLDALERIGGFNEKRPYTMDLDAFLRLKKLGSFVSTRTLVSAFRWHSESLTVSSRKASAREALEVKRMHLPTALQRVSIVWLAPVAWATEAAGTIVNRRAAKLRENGA